MGTRGPIPKSSEDRKRRNKPSEGAAKPVRLAVETSAKAPPMNAHWAPIAKRFWAAYKKSEQTKFFQPTDWALLYSLMDDLSYAVKQPKRPAVLLQTIYSGLSDLLVSEGSRRRLNIELYRPTSEELEDAGVVEMNAWAEKFGAG